MHLELLCSFRTFSNSPESLDIPRLVLTNPEGTNGSHLECFNDLEHLTLDANDMMLCNGSGDGGQVRRVSFFFCWLISNWLMLEVVAVRKLQVVQYVFSSMFSFLCDCA